MLTYDQFLKEASELAERSSTYPGHEWVTKEAKGAKFLARSYVDGQNRCWTVHVVYSLSYEVPLLLFNVHGSNGHLLSPEDLMNSLPEASFEPIRANRYEALTQMEHPLLSTPFFGVHPCRTTKLMTQLSNTKKFLVPWLSVYAGLIGCELPLELISEVLKN